jgi:hypothetical protein
MIEGLLAYIAVMLTYIFVVVAIATYE